MCHFDFIEFYEPLKNESSFFTVEIDEELEGANMVASSCNSQETVVDSGVDSEATTPSSPEDEASEETEKSSSKEEPALSNDEMVLETAETLLALSGKKPTGTAAASSQKDTAVVLPQQPQDDAKGSTPLLRLFSMFYVPMRTSRAMWTMLLLCFPIWFYLNKIFHIPFSLYASEPFKKERFLQRHDRCTIIRFDDCRSPKSSLFSSFSSLSISFYNFAFEIP